MDAQSRWRIAIFLTAVVIILQLLCVMLTSECLSRTNSIMRKQQVLEEHLANLAPLLEDNSLNGDSQLSLKKAIALLTSIERFIRTTPLVECGNYGHRKEGSVQESDK
jgi:hypothetical protein